MRVDRFNTVHFHSFFGSNFNLTSHQTNSVVFAFGQAEAWLKLTTDACFAWNVLRFYTTIKWIYLFKVISHKIPIKGFSKKKKLVFWQENKIFESQTKRKIEQRKFIYLRYLNWEDLDELFGDQQLWRCWEHQMSYDLNPFLNKKIAQLFMFN